MREFGIPEIDKVFFGQFLVTTQSWEPPPSFDCHAFGSWNLFVHEALPVHILSADDGTQLGFVLGFPIIKGQLFSCSSEIIVCAGPTIVEDELEWFLSETSGRYLVLFFEGHPLSPIVYPDPFCSLSAVYSGDGQKLASTTSLLHYTKKVKLSYSLDIYPHGGPFWYPLTLTDSKDCQRLLPNHYLDLSSWKSIRFWPMKDLELCSEKTKDQYVQAAIKAIRDNLCAIANVEKTFIGLTAGRDSRVLLACSCEEIRKRTTFITFRYPEKTNQIERDVQTAQILAKRFILNHMILEVKEVPISVRESYFYRIGRSGSSDKARDYYQAAITNLDMKSAWLTGFGGEVAVMYFAKDEDTRVRPTALELLRRVHQPCYEAFVQSVQSWLDDLPESISNQLIVELFYLENRVSSWACPHFYGAAPFSINMTPFSDRRYISACYSLPYDFRRSRASQIRMIEMADSRLLDIPFERLAGWPLFRRRLKQNRFYKLS